MSTATAQSQKEQISKMVGEAIGPHLKPIEEIYKALSGPASKAGLTPEQFLARTVEKAGDNPLAFAGPGMTPMLMPSVPDLLKGRRIGKVKSKETGKLIDFGEMLCSLHAVESKGTSPDEYRKHRDILHDMGVRISKGWQSRDEPVTKSALMESAGTVGGYTVPPEFVQELLTLPLEEMVMGSKGAKTPMKTRTMTLPSLDMTTVQAAGTSAILGGVLASWLDEMGTLPETEPTFRQTELTAWQLCCYSVASNTLLQDSAIALDSLLTKLFTMASAYYRDYAYFQGNGVGKPLGVLNCPATIQVTRAIPGRIVWTDIANMLSKLYVMLAKDDVFWAMHQTCIPELIRMKDDAGRPIFIPLDQGIQADISRPKGVQSFGKLLGKDVYITEKLPALGTTGDLMLIDGSKYLLGDRMEVEIEMSTQVKFTQYATVWRTVWRGDGQPWLNNPITLLDGTSQVSVFVALAA